MKYMTYIKYMKYFEIHLPMLKKLHSILSEGIIDL